MTNTLGWMVASAAVLAASPVRATVIETGAYEAGTTSRSGSVGLGPGAYRFDLTFTTPVMSVSGFVEKQTVSNFFCIDPEIGPDEFVCGGDEVPTQPLFEQVSPTLWSLFLTVDKPRSYPINGGTVVRGEDFDICCSYSYDFEAEAEGVFTFSYTEVPEPATWAFMINGLALIGAVTRGRRTFVSYD